MRDWVIKKLSDLGTFRSSGADKLSLPSELPVRLVNYMDVYRSERISNRIQFQNVTASEREIANCGLKRADVLFTPSSETPDDIGHASVVTEDLDGAVYSYHVVRFRLHKPEAFDVDFLAYVFNQASARNHFSARATGITRYTLNRSDFNSLELRFTNDIAEQRAIAQSIRLVDTHIATTQSAISAAEHLQQGLMRELLSGRLNPDGSTRSSREFVVHRKLGLVPVGWNVEPLKNLADIQRGRFSHRPRNEPRFYGGLHPFIQTGEVSSSRGYIRSHNQTLTDAGAAISRLFPKGTVFISIVGANVAKAAIASYDVYAPDSVIGMIPTGVIVPELLELWLRMNQTRIALLAGDSARENLNYTILKPMLVAFPKDEAEQREIADRLYDLENLMDAKRVKIAALQRLKKSLMQNLLTGHMRLSPEAIAELTAEAGKSGGA